MSSTVKAVLDGKLTNEALGLLHRKVDDAQLRIEASEDPDRYLVEVLDGYQAANERRQLVIYKQREICSGVLRKRLISRRLNLLRRQL